MTFAYTYVLKCADGNLYIGSTDDLKRRMLEHRDGMCSNTSKRLPLELIYYEACRSLAAAREREKQLKTGFGRGYLRKRVGFEFSPG
jgi:putative endonuclease